MKKIAFVLALFILSSCAKDIVDLSCSISGTVKDKDNGRLIDNCLVSLSNGLSRSTTSSGVFEFDDLEAGSYTLTFSKAGYYDATQSITMTAGKDQTIDVLLKCKEPLSASSSVLDFGDFESSKSLVLANNSDGPITYEILNKPSWAQISQLKGTISIGSSAYIDVIVDRSKLQYGNYTQILTISYSGSKSGSTSVEIVCSKVQLTVPTVSIHAQAEDIKQNEFTIQGNITKTGGSEIIAYGHCWSTSPNPTIAHNRNDMGRTSKVGNFSSHITNLTTFTSYYVRAYATNAQGTAYSEQIVVTTQDIESNKWDGTIENKFAGGSGSKTNPYIIKTGGQLLHIKDDNGKYYRLEQNINLDNRNWLPFELEGSLDGNGCTISNLRISRQEDNLGLFSKLSEYGSLSNLTIQGVDIQAPEQSNIGAFVGEAKASITNCILKMTATSMIKGNENIGGIVGSNVGSYLGEIMISYCKVTSDESFRIIGNMNVGGICGYQLNGWPLLITDCHASVSLEIGECGGGIVGNGGIDLCINNCSYSGAICGDKYLGGIQGHSSRDNRFVSAIIRGCKSDVYIKGTDCLGGIIGGNPFYRMQSVCDIFGCYSKGTINAPNGAKNIGSISGGGTKHFFYGIDYCYSVIVGYALDPYLLGRYPDFLRFCTDNTKSDDIATFFKELYSNEVYEYFNLDNTWTWSGVVDGKQKTVICPKLKWEE